jgi:hypothetical protein
MKSKILSVVMVSVLFAGCKTYNAVIHKGPGKEVPATWDFDEPVTANVFNTGVVNMKKACSGKPWETAKIYYQWFIGWKIAVRCAS